MNCDVGSKTFANKQNLYRHLRNIHNNESSKSEQRNCMNCLSKSYSPGVIKNTLKKNSRAKQKLCICSTSLVSDTKSFNKHLQEVHSVPPHTQTQNSKRKVPQTSAFSDTVETHIVSKRRS